MKKILLGVTSGVAIYKACELIRSLRKADCEIKVMMTPAATKLISPHLFETLSSNPVYVEIFDRQESYSIEHISLAEWADLAVIVPCTLSTLSKISHGICDNLLSTVFLALPATTPKIIAPAMNVNMWENPITQKNIETLNLIPDLQVVEPQEGELACGVVGKGRLADLQTILDAILA